MAVFVAMCLKSETFVGSFKSKNYLYDKKHLALDQQRRNPQNHLQPSIPKLYVFVFSKAHIKG